MHYASNESATPSWEALLGSLIHAGERHLRRPDTEGITKELKEGTASLELHLNGSTRFVPRVEDARLEAHRPRAVDLCDLQYWSSARTGASTMQY